MNMQQQPSANAGVPGLAGGAKGQKKAAAAAAKHALNAYNNLSWFSKLTYPFRHVNESKLAVGFIMILMNIGMKYVDFGFSKTQEQALRNGVARELIIFAVCFMGTRDLFLALLLTGSFMIMADVLFNEKSNYCVVPNYMKRMQVMVDTNMENGVVTQEEEKRALQILDKAERMRQNSVQANMHSYLAAHV